MSVARHVRGALPQEGRGESAVARHTPALTVARLEAILLQPEHYQMFRISYQDAAVHARIAAVIACASVAAFLVLGSSIRSVFGPIKWADFVHFYTLGSIAASRDVPLLYDLAGQHARQLALVPASDGETFLPVYGPQTALLFAPLSRLPFVAAALSWTVMTIAVYAWAVWLAWRPVKRSLPDRNFLVAAACGFPPFWQLIAHGQTTAIILLAFAGGWWLLETERRFLAGIVLSLIAIKPQFGLVLGPVALLCLEWNLIGGLCLGLALQALAVVAVFGSSAIPAYVTMLRSLPALSAYLEPRPAQMHSLRAVTRLLPSELDSAVWTILAIGIIGFTVSVWRRQLPLRVRFGILLLASILVNPHLTIYDVTVLALPILWVGGWLLDRDTDSSWFWQRIYWIFVALLLPTAAFARIQLSALLLFELFVRIARPGRSAGLLTTRASPAL